MESQLRAQLSQRQPHSQTPNLVAWGLGTTPLAYRTALEVNNNHSNRGNAMAESLTEEANAIGDRRKSTETEARSPLATAYACTGHFPPKFEPTNQITALGSTGARASGRLLRVYKVGSGSAEVIRARYSLGEVKVR